MSASFEIVALTLMCLITLFLGVIIYELQDLINIGRQESP